MSYCVLEYSARYQDETTRQARSLLPWTLYSSDEGRQEASVPQVEMGDSDQGEGCPGKGDQSLAVSESEIHIIPKNQTF